MAFLNWGVCAPVSIAETVETFKELALPLVAKGNMDGVNRVYKEAYAEVMKGRKSGSLENMLATRAMEQALQEVLVRDAKERQHYFTSYRDDWWRKK